MMTIRIWITVVNKFAMVTFAARNALQFTITAVSREKTRALLSLRLFASVGLYDLFLIRELPPSSYRIEGSLSLARAV